MNQNTDMGKKEPLVTEEMVYNVLRQCNDPEIPINIVDLGLIYGVKITGDHVEVIMTLTTPGCGMGGYIANQIREKLITIPGVYEAEVKIVWEPKWDKSRIDPETRKKLGLDI